MYYSSDYQLSADFNWSFEDPIMMAQREKPGDHFDSAEMSNNINSVNPRRNHPELVYMAGSTSPQVRAVDKTLSANLNTPIIANSPADQVISDGGIRGSDVGTYCVIGDANPLMFISKIKEGFGNGDSFSWTNIVLIVLLAYLLYKLIHI